MIPEGITTALVHMDAPVSFVGVPGRLHIIIEPSMSLIWTATGTPLGNFVDSLSLDPGAELQVELPHTDQAGFQDAQGNAYTGWYYSVTVTYERDGRRINFPKRDFQILTGQDSVDLALVPADEAVPAPSIAPILPVTSIEGITGSVTLEDLDLGEVDNTPDADKPVSGPQAAALVPRLFNGEFSTASANGVNIVDTNIAPKATLRFEDTAAHESSILEIAHKGSAPLGTGGGQAYGINIANHPGARNAFTIHQYSSFAPAVQIDNTDINSAIYIKNTDNQTQNPGNYGTGPFLQLKPQAETDALFLTDDLVWNNLTGKDMRIIGQNAGQYTLNVETPATRDTRALYVSKQGLGVGNALDVLNKGTGAGINLSQTGAGTGLNITMTDPSGAAKYGIFVTAKNYGTYVKTTTDGGVTLDVDKTGTGNGTAAKIRNLGTGDSLSFVNASVQVARVSASGEYENVTAGAGVILKSPDGTRFRLTVGNDGALTTTAL